MHDVIALLNQKPITVERARLINRLWAFAHLGVFIGGFVWAFLSVHTPETNIVRSVIACLAGATLMTTVLFIFSLFRWDYGV